MKIAPAAAAARIQEQLGSVTPSVTGALVTIDTPPDRWQALGRAAREAVGCL
jgi:hypothetical protein